MAELVPGVTLHTGHKMPNLGLGTFQAVNDTMENAMECALELGYRHFDTAYYYRNEGAIGNVLKRWLDEGKVTREELFIVTKLPVVGCRAASVEKYLTRSLEALQLDYVDLYLIHYPVPLQETHDDNFYPMNDDGSAKIDLESDHISLWRGMEAQVYAGRALHIGISNFNARQTERIVKAARIRPAINQFETHIYFQNKELTAFCRGIGLRVTGYAPFACPSLNDYKASMGINAKEVQDFREDPVIQEIAEQHGKTPAQVVLRFFTQKGVIVIPKSANPDRMKENIEVFDFELTLEQMRSLSDLDKGPANRVYDLSVFLGTDVHPEYPFGDLY